MQTKKQLTEYFQGKRNFFDVPLAPHGTDFQLMGLQRKEILMTKNFFAGSCLCGSVTYKVSPPYKKNYGVKQ
jgi:hypothetical protein